jgi:hypothetical protein
MVLSALNRIPRAKMPKDLAVVGIIVQAAELIPWALLVSCGNQRIKGFNGDGINELLQWLDRCYELFAHVAEVSHDLPNGRSNEKLVQSCRHTAGEIRYLSGQLRESLEELEREREAHGGEHGSTCAECAKRFDEDGNPILSPLFVPGENFAHIAAHLYELIGEWLDADSLRVFMDRVTEDNRSIVHSRSLVEAEDGPGDS